MKMSAVGALEMLTCIGCVLILVWVELGIVTVYVFSVWVELQIVTVYQCVLRLGGVSDSDGVCVLGGVSDSDGVPVCSQPCLGGVSCSL